MVINLIKGLKHFKMENIKETSKPQSAKVRRHLSALHHMNAVPRAKTPEYHTATCTLIREKLGFTVPSSSNTQPDEAWEKKGQKLIIPRWKTTMQIQQDSKKLHAIPSKTNKSLIGTLNLTQQAQKEQKHVPKTSMVVPLKTGKPTAQCIKQLYSNDEKQTQQYSRQTPIIAQPEHPADHLVGRSLKNGQKSPFKKPKILITQQTTGISGNKKNTANESTKGVPLSPKINKPVVCTQATHPAKPKNPTSEKPIQKNSIKQNNKLTTSIADTAIPQVKRIKTLSASKAPPKTEEPKIIKITTPTDNSTPKDAHPIIITRLKSPSTEDSSTALDKRAQSINVCHHGIYIYPPPIPKTPSSTSISVQVDEIKPECHPNINKSEHFRITLPGEENAIPLPNKPTDTEKETILESQLNENNVCPNVPLSLPTNNVNPIDKGPYIIVPTKYKSNMKRTKLLKKPKNSLSNSNKPIKTPTTSNNCMKVKWAQSIRESPKQKTVSASQIPSEKSIRCCDKSLKGTKKGKPETKKMQSIETTLRNTCESVSNKSSKHHLKPVVRKHSSISFRSSKHTHRTMKRAKPILRLSPSQTTVQTQTSRVVLTHNHNLPLCCLIWGHEDNLKKRIVPRAAYKMKNSNKKTRIQPVRKRKSFSSNFFKRRRNLPAKMSSRSIFSKKSSRLLNRISSTSMSPGSPSPSQQPSRVLIRCQDPPYVMRRHHVSHSVASLRAGSCPTFGYPCRPFTPMNLGSDFQELQKSLPRSIMKKLNTRNIDGSPSALPEISSQPNTSTKTESISPSQSVQSMSHWNPSSAPHKQVSYSSGTIPWVAWPMRPKISRTFSPLTIDTATSTGSSGMALDPRKTHVDAATEPFTPTEINSTYDSNTLITNTTSTPSICTDTLGVVTNAVSTITDASGTSDDPTNDSGYVTYSTAFTSASGSASNISGATTNTSGSIIGGSAVTHSNFPTPSTPVRNKAHATTNVSSPGTKTPIIKDIPITKPRPVPSPSSLTTSNFPTTTSHGPRTTQVISKQGTSSDAIMDSSILYLLGRDPCTTRPMTLSRVRGSTDMRSALKSDSSNKEHGCSEKK